MKLILPGKRRFKPLDIVLAVLLAGWVPSLLMAFVAYSILTRTLESKIIVDRRTVVQTLARLLGADFTQTREVLGYYQTLPVTQQMVTRPYGDRAAQDWLAEAYYSHPRLDGVFLTDRAGKLIASLPYSPEMIGQNFAPGDWLEGASLSDGCYVSSVAPRPPDNRLSTFVVMAVRPQSGGPVTGYIGATILVERLGKRMAGFDFGELSVAQVIDQNGFPLFTPEYRPTEEPNPAARNDLLRALSANAATGFFELGPDIFSHSPIDGTDWKAVLSQPRAVAYRPMHELVTRTVVLAGWLVVGTGIAAWFLGRLYARQIGADERIAKETFFSEKILSNMPVGIALVDPATHRFLKVNDTFRAMAFEPEEADRARDVSHLRFSQLKFGIGAMFENDTGSDTAFGAHELNATDRNGRNLFLTVNLLRLQDEDRRFQGILLLIEDNTADVMIRTELIAANTAKDQFLAQLSHELRNPLSPVIAMVSELEKRVDGSPEVDRALEIIRRNVELEARLIDDLLDVTRISHGKLQLTVETVDAHHLIERAIEICEKEIDSKGLKVVKHLAAKNHYLRADPARIQQVFWNLIKNAVKFTPEGGSISISTRNLANGKLLIEVTDTGIGIESNRLDKIFKAFEQADTSITRRFGGLGLGLAISKAMVDAHDGTLTVHSAGEDKGSTFSIELSTTTPPAEGSAGPQKASTDTGAHRGDRILIVDDHEDTCLGMKLLLERRGYAVKTAHTVAGALDLAASEKFDLVISDLGLPDASGFELMEKLRARGDLTPGIALSGFGMESDIERSRQAGFFEHLIKPINIERLEVLLREMPRPA